MDYLFYLLKIEFEKYQNNTMTAFKPAYVYCRLYTLNRQRLSNRESPLHSANSKFLIQMLQQNERNEYD